MELTRSRSAIEEKFFDLCTKVVEENNLKIYDLDYLPGPSALRVYIMNPESETAVIDDCIKIDKALSPFIDEESWMPKELTLEVSSPGLFRDLRQKWHFEMSLDQRVQLVLKKFLGDIDQTIQEKLPKKVWKSKKVVGFLKDISDAAVNVSFEDCLVSISLNEVKKVNLEPEL